MASLLRFRTVMVMVVMVDVNFSHLVLCGVTAGLRGTLVMRGAAGLLMLGLRLGVAALASSLRMFSLRLVRFACHGFLASVQRFHLAKEAHLGSLVGVRVA